MQYFKIGKLVATHGFKGDLVLLHELGKKTSLKGLKTIFLENKTNSFLPWFIQSVKIRNEKEVLLKLEGIDSKETAIALLQKQVWLPEEDFKKYSARTAPAAMLGYEVIDQGNPLGKILELIEQPHQLLCRLDIRGKEVLIPLHEESLRKIDHRKKEIWVEIPDGLLDIYLA